MVTITLICPYCASVRLIKYGVTPNGKQRYQCGACGRQHREHPDSNAYSAAERELILRAYAYQERSSWRGLSRTFGVTPNTRSAPGLKKALSLPPLEQTLAPAEPGGAFGTGRDVDFCRPSPARGDLVVVGLVPAHLADRRLRPGAAR